MGDMLSTIPTIIKSYWEIGETPSVLEKIHKQEKNIAIFNREHGYHFESHLPGSFWLPDA